MKITFGDVLELDLSCAEGEPPRLSALRVGGVPIAAESPDPGTRRLLPLSHLELAGHGRAHSSGKRHIGGAVSGRLRYRGHESSRSGDRLLLEIESQDPVTGLTVVACLEQHAGIAAVRSWTRVTAGEPGVVLLHATSLLVPGVLPIADGRWEDRLVVWSAADPWCGEGRWSSATLADAGLTPTDRPDARNRVARASTGSWSSSEHLPMAVLTDEQTGRAVAWQIEHNGSWAWEIGDTHEAVYVGVSGPCDELGQWSKRLAPGETFTTVPATLAAAAEEGMEGAVAALTAHRRVSRRAHDDHERLPIIFNDYMNCLSGDPSTERLLPLIEAAGRAGAEYFVVDAGWYDDTDGWWDSVGAWQASTVRFPGGLGKVMDRVRERGMIPGLWLEPEVVGVRSPIARSLPDEAFFQRGGARLEERGRYQLDFRNRQAREHLDSTVDRLIGEYGLGYLKLDYNIEIGPGTDHDADSPGDGLLGHNRAYLAWMAAVLDRHPGLVIESCASGGMRTDPAMLATAQLHSGTDQTDFRRLPAIAAAAPMAVPPEQSAMWVYPQPEMTDRETAFNLVTALLGRIHLSGRLDRLRPGQEALTREALAVYRKLRRDLREAVPHWPLGLPAWADGWISLALATPESPSTAGYILAWRRADRADRTGRTDERDHVDLPVPWAVVPPHGTEVRTEVVFPASSLSGARVTWHAHTASLTLHLPEWSAVLVRLTRA